MALNVIMIGASRSGKTSILASMLNNIRDNRGENNVCDYFHVHDHSEYSSLEPWRQEQVCLQENIDGMKDLLKTQVQGVYVPKMGALQGSINPFQYIMDVQYKLNNIVSKKTLQIIFNDIPGEYCTIAKYHYIRDDIKKSQILIVAVDVPSLMYAREAGKETLNSVMNCPEELLNALEDLGTDCYDDIQDEEERNKELNKLLRMVVFVPIKCEYWLQNGRRQEIIDEIKRVYEQTIIRCQNFENIQVMVLPVETIGSCLFDHHSDENNSLILKYGKVPTSKMYTAEDEIDNKKTVRCERISESQVRLKNGVIYDMRPEDTLISAQERRQHPYCYDGGTKLIPYTWFKAVSGNFAPKYCELLFCRILKFSIIDLAKRTGHSAREAFDDTETFWQRIKAVPNFIHRWLSGQRTAYSDVEQMRNFQCKIQQMEKNGIIDEKYITYLVNREDGKDLLESKIDDHSLVLYAKS